MPLIHPEMKTTELDHSVDIRGGVVRRWERDAEIAKLKYLRSHRSLLEFTSQWHFTTDPNVYEYWYIRGREATRDDIPDIVKALIQLHSTLNTYEMCSREMLDTLWIKRPLARLRDAGVDRKMHNDMCEALLPLLDRKSQLVTWHGDATLSNTIITKHGVRFIDHAAPDKGPREYDYAKMYRALVLSDDGVVDHNGWKHIPHSYHRYVLAHVAAMTGRHIGEQRRKALEVCFTYLQCQ